VTILVKDYIYRSYELPTPWLFS